MSDQLTWSGEFLGRPAGRLTDFSTTEEMELMEVIVQTSGWQVFIAEEMELLQDADPLDRHQKTPSGRASTSSMLSMVEKSKG